MSAPQIAILVLLMWLAAHAAWIHTGNETLRDVLYWTNFTIGAAMLLGTIILL